MKSRTGRPAPTNPERSRIMRAVARTDTGPELRLQHALRSLGLRFSKNAKELPGSPDIVFRKARIAVFVHGCFWHRHRNCRLATVPHSNQEYWSAKFAANVARDRRNVSELRKLGWKVVIAWQCQLESNVGRIARRIKALLKNRGG